MRLGTQTIIVRASILPALRSATSAPRRTGHPHGRQVKIKQRLGHPSLCLAIPNDEFLDRGHVTADLDVNEVVEGAIHTIQ